MDPKNPLHLAALLCAAAAVFWGVTTFLGITLPLAVLCGLAAGILFMFPRRLDATQKNRLRGVGLALVIMHAILLLLFMLTTPVNIGEDPERGINLDPPGWAVALMDVYTVLLFVFAAVLLPAGIVLLAGTPERALAGIGAALVILVVLLSLIGIQLTDPLGLLFQLLFLLGFLAIATACILPPFKGDQPPWNGAKAGERTPADA